MVWGELEKGRSEAKVHGRLWIGANYLASPSISLFINQGKENLSHRVVNIK